MGFAFRGVEPRGVGIAGALLVLAASSSLVASGATGGLGSASERAGAGAPAAGQAAPLVFVRNAGQTDPQVRYEGRSGEARFYFTRRGVVLALPRGKRGVALQLKFPGANPRPAIVARERAAGRVNYMRGSDSRDWQTGLSTYRELVYRDLWPGIDLAFRGAGGALKYEFRLRPGARIGDIGLAYAGASRLALDGSGALLLHTPAGVLRDAAPRSYELVGGRRVPVASQFAVVGRTVGFQVTGRRASRPLVIDPGLVYSTFIGGSGGEIPAEIFVDASGSVYLAGGTNSMDFPTTPGAYDRFRNNTEAFVTKLNPDGSQLVYSTFVGGFIDETAAGLAVDPSGNAYITGQTTSRNYPTTEGAYDRTFNENTDPNTQSWTDGFVTKLSSTGGLAYSTFLGGTGHAFRGPPSPIYQDNEGGTDVAVADDGSAYVTGYTGSADFPTTPGAYDSTLNGHSDDFVTKLDPTGSSLVFATLIGGSEGFYGGETGGEIALDASGNPYLAGRTDSSGYPTTLGAYRQVQGGQPGGHFITKFTVDGTGLVYSTGFPPFNDVSVSDDGHVYLTGRADDTSFPVTPGAYDRTLESYEAFAAKLNQAGSGLVYSTLIGGGGVDAGDAIAVDAAGRAWIAGATSSTNFPTTPGAYAESLDPTTGNGFVVELNPLGTSLLYGTYIAPGPSAPNIAVDAAGDIYVSGYTTSASFPTTPGGYDPTFNGGTDVVAFKLHPTTSAPVAQRLYTSLVPMLRQTISSTQCQARGGTASTHGAPLSLASCDPPGYLPGTQAKLGPNADGSAVITVVPGRLDTATDEADVSIAVKVLDVRDRASGADYNAVPGGPDLTLTPVMRVTDTYNGASLTDRATTVDFDFPVAIDCAANSDPAFGSTCTIGVTMDSLMPGVIKEGKDMSIALWRLWLNDSGANAVRGDGDDRVFAQSGIYVP